MATIGSIVCLIVGFALFVVAAALWLNIRAYNRATCCSPIWYKHGMAVTKEGKLVGLETPVYRDPQTGIQFDGPTNIIGDKEKD